MQKNGGFAKVTARQVGSSRPLGNSQRRCDRCGRVWNGANSKLIGGLILCKDCKLDKWYINQATKEAS